MPSDLHKEEDEDIYGIPRRVHEANNARWNVRKNPRRFLPAVGVIGVIFLYYLLWPASTKADWSRFAYVSYATDDNNLCSSYMLFEALDRLGSKADRVLLYNAQWATEGEGGRSRSSALLTRAERQYKVKLRPVQPLDERGQVSYAAANDGPSTWDTSITRLRAFELTGYERVLSLDSDVMMYQNLDELFLLPKTPVAMPRAYWTDAPPGQWPLSSLMVLLEPNIAEFRNMLDMLASWRMDPKTSMQRQYNMELLNNRFASSALVIPHRPYALLSAEFRRHDHSAYLGTINGPQSLQSLWDADAVLKEAKLVFFSDWPLPKPYVMWPHDAVTEIQPNCTALGTTNAQYSCREREIWKNLYNDYRKKRKDMCKLLSVSAPDWAAWKQQVGAVLSI